MPPARSTTGVPMMPMLGLMSKSLFSSRYGPQVSPASDQELPPEVSLGWVLAVGVEGVDVILRGGDDQDIVKLPSLIWYWRR